MHRISKELGRDIHWLKSKPHNSPHTSSDGHCPDVPACRLPISCQDRLRSEVPSLAHVVADEVLQPHLIDIWTSSRTSDRPYVVHDDSKSPMARLG